MKELLTTLFEHARNTSGPTRVVVAAGLVVVLVVAGLVGYRAANPHMIPLYWGLDDERFSAVAQALSNANLRFETSSPPAPYSVFVASGEKHEALAAIHAVGAMADGAKGIQSNAGSGTIWMGQSEREQLTRKRDWEDLEKQLEALSFVRMAVVRTSGASRSPMMRAQIPPTVSVIVTLASGISPSAEQRSTLASIVHGATSVPAENITIADQAGNTLFDGSRDDAMNAVLEFEQDFAESQSRFAQDFLDRAFGPGLTVVSVTGEWTHDRTESVDESLDPAKLTVSESKSETTTPIEPSVGGPAGTASSIDQGGTVAAAEPVPVAETIDSDTRFTYGSKTTHLVQDAPQLQRLSVTLLIDTSLASQLQAIEGLVKELVGFDEARDQIAASTTDIFGLLRDAQGQLIPIETETAPEPPSALLTMLIERGIEILAAGAFISLLIRSLRRSRRATALADEGASGAAGENESVDMDDLARRQIEQLVADDPERVGSLLSRWAQTEKKYAGAKE